MKKVSLKKVALAVSLSCMAATASADHSPVGVWTLGYDWGCNGGYSKTPLTLNADGTFSLQSYTGYWWESHGSLTFTFTTGTSYTGYHVNSSMTGVQRSSSGSLGCWYAHPDDGFNYDIVPGAADVIGPEG